MTAATSAVVREKDMFETTAIKEEELIRRRAKQIYEKHGKQQGHDLDNWLQAEKEIKGAIHIVRV